MSEYINDNYESSIDNFINNNFNNDEVESIKEEVDEIYDELISSDSCVFYMDNLITPSTIGLSFYQYSNLFTAINMIIPDLFRASFTRDPIEFRKSPSLICPTYSRIPLNRFSDSMKYSYNNYIQLLLPENIIKGFLYYNFSSNPFDMAITDIPFFFLKYRWYDTNPSLSETVNQSNYTAPSTLFNYYYNKDCLLVQLLAFNTKMDNSTKEQGSVNNTNFPPYTIPWITTYGCLNNKPDPNKFFSYNNVENPLKNNLLLYSDLFYLSKSKVNISSVADQAAAYTNEFVLDEVIKKNNIYTLLGYANDVYNEILKEIDSLLTYKTYNYPEYTNFETLVQCKDLYCNYVSNEAFIFTNSPNFNNLSEICKISIAYEIYEIIMNPNYDLEEHNLLKKKLEEKRT